MSHPYPGALVTYEGIDGAGKNRTAPPPSTCATICWIRSSCHQGARWHTYRSYVEKVLLKKKECNPRVEFCSLLPTVLSILCVWLSQRSNEELYLCDRMADSSLAYQGFGRGLDTELIKHVNTWAMQSIEPDLTYYVDVSHDVALARRTARDSTQHTMEREQAAFGKKLFLDTRRLPKSMHALPRLTALSHVIKYLVLHSSI